MSTLIADLRIFNDIILESFLEGLTPRECAIRLGQKGFNPPPSESDLADNSAFLETMKQVLFDEFYDVEKVKSLMNLMMMVKTMTKGVYALVEEGLRAANIAFWLPSAYVNILRTKFGFALNPK